jgi:hypothetical protein
MITSASRTKAEGILICRKGDTYNCPIHGPNPIVDPLTTRTNAETPLIAVDQAVTACGATIQATATRTKAE